ncbi:hypothetical protein BC940DRAFT_46440 [Gongronella butleri]|nr:hypothetical protein BC940DRAFT_46440 [Gongronella butleri]
MFISTAEALELFVREGHIELLTLKDKTRVPARWTALLEQQKATRDTDRTFAAADWVVGSDGWPNDVVVRLQGRDHSRSMPATRSLFGGKFPTATDDDDDGFGGNTTSNGSKMVYFLETHKDPRFFGCDAYSGTEKSLIQGNILVVSRGLCDFEQKVRHAQSAGAKAVLFINNVPQAGPFQALGQHQQHQHQQEYHEHAYEPRTTTNDMNDDAHALPEQHQQQPQQQKQQKHLHPARHEQHNAAGRALLPSATLTRENGLLLLDFLSLNDQVAVHVMQKPRPQLLHDPSSWMGVKIQGFLVHNWVVIKP